MKGIQPGFKSKGSTVGIGKDKGKKKQKEKKGKKKEKKDIKYFLFSKKSSESNPIDEYPTNKYLKFNNKEQVIEHSSINYKESLDIFSGSSNDIIRSEYSEKVI